MLITDDRQDPASSSLPIDGLGLPGTSRLFGARLVLGGSALVRPAAAVADQVASDDVVVGHFGAARVRTMRAGSDDSVAFFFHALDQLLLYSFEVGVDLALGDRDSVENAEHGGEEPRSDAPWVRMRLVSICLLAGVR